MMYERNGSSLFPLAEQETDQFKLTRIQTFNWGTFSNIFDYAIPPQGFLFVGPSGSGKSTILDAHAALMTPPKWVDFNVAAREAERSGKDRNVMTYIRGAWAQQTGDSGEYVSQYLRSDTTWTAIAETYRDGQGKVVVLAQVLWIRGKSTANGDVKKYYLVLEREFDVRELQFLAEHNFDVRRFKIDLPDAFAKDEFSAYQERFRRLLGIDSERALRLLHKTQSAKNLGDLNTFLRDFMLDPPETFELADKLVAQFRELDDAHKAVVDARRQIETLKPAQVDFNELDASKRAKNELDELSAGVDKYREQKRKLLLEIAIAEGKTELAGMEQETRRLDGLASNQYLTLRALQDQRSEQGGSLLERLDAELKDAEAARATRKVKREAAHSACEVMGWAPPDSAVWFTQRREAAASYLLDASDRSEALREKAFDAYTRLNAKTAAFAKVRLEVAAMERQRSNIPSHMLAIRENIARELGIAEEKLPFAGELIEVKSEEGAWQGAIERLLNSFAQSLLVDDRYYSQVSSYLEATFLGARLAYFRVVAQTSPAQRTIPANAVVKKLNFASGPHANWSREELKARFDYECADTVHAFRAATRAITKAGQIKHSHTRHEKNDRYRVDDRSRWVLGFDNASKLDLFKRDAFALAQEIATLDAEVKASKKDDTSERAKLVACSQLANTTWEELDLQSALARVASLLKDIDAERDAHPDLALLDDQIEKQREKFEAATLAKSKYAGKVSGEERAVEALEKRLGSLRPELLTVALTPFQQRALDERYGRHEHELETLDSVTTQVVRQLNSEERAHEGKIQQLQNVIERRFAEFVRIWPAEAGGLDATLASAPDFFSKLARLETDGLPKYEARFLQLLHDNSDQGLARLSTQLDNERKAIRDRMGIVNDSLEGAPFGPGTHLVIETHDKMLDTVVEFKQSLKASLSQSLSADPEVLERRFAVINALVKRFASQETTDRNWRSLVLDVRQHVDFVARELDADDVEVDVYRSGAGKSGGQRQKLAATCLAAALRYQLGGQDRALPRFSTVVLDEAFDKADAEFTSMAMNIFKTFGFQMVVATPMKSVMTLEPFIGGACFVHIKDRKTSAVIQIDYDLATQRLKMNSEVTNVEEAAAA